VTRAQMGKRSPSAAGMDDQYASSVDTQVISEGTVGRPGKEAIYNQDWRKN
jgi:hypothetical protein